MLSTRTTAKRRRIGACALALSMLMAQPVTGSYAADAYVGDAYTADAYAADEYAADAYTAGAYAADAYTAGASATDSGFATAETRAQPDHGNGSEARAASQHDLDVIHRDLGGYPSVSATYNGGVTAIGDGAFVLAANPDTTPILAAARYGAGRVVVAGDDSYFKFTSDITDDRRTVARNILIWATEEAEPLTYQDALDGAGTLPLLTATSKNFAADSRYPIQVLTSDSFHSFELDPARYPVAYVDATMKQDEIDALASYVERGGSIVVAMKGWVMEQYPHVFLGEAYQGRTAKLSEDYPLQRLLNRMGLGLMNNIATTKSETFPKLTEQGADHYHAAALVDQAKRVEAGQLDPNQLEIGPAGADVKKKLQVLAAITGGTFGGLTAESPMYAQIQQDAEHLDTDLSFPLDRSLAPYSSALLAYKLSLVGNQLDAPKSPYADNFPGPVPADAPRVQQKTVTVDFDYSTFDYLRQGTVPKNWISTGLYAPAGEWLTVHVPEGTAGLDVQVGAHTDNLTSQNVWKRIPVVTQRKTLAPGENRIRSPYGGLLYLIPTKPQAGVRKDIAIEGGVEAPYYVLGQTADEEWRSAISQRPAPWAELQGRRVILTLPSEYVRNLGDPKLLLEQWDRIVEYTDEAAGLSPEAPLPHRSVNLPFRYVADRQISAGFMHAGYPIMFQIDPSAAHAVDIERVTRNGWGFWHETGHEYQQGSWNWDVTGEVTVNIYSLYVQQKFGNPSNLLTRNNEGKDFYDRAQDYMEHSDPGTTVYGKSGQDLFVNLVLFRQLSLAYGWDFYQELHRAYRELPANQLPADNQAKIDLFVVMASKTAGEDLTEFFDKWFLKYTPGTVKAQIAALNLPKPSQPIWKLRETEGIEAPVIDLAPKQEWTKEKVEVEVINPTPIEEGSGLRNQYKVGEDGTWTEYREPFTIDAEGVTNVYARVRQLSGVTSDEVMASVKIDRTAPLIETSVTDTVYGSTPITLPITATDALSGMQTLTVLLDGAPLKAPYVIVPSELAAGRHELKITAVDYAGNAREVSLAFAVVKTVSVQALYDAVDRAGAEGRITNRGIVQALKSHIAKVEKGDVNDPDTYRALEQFIQAQSGKHIDEQTASELLRLIARLQDA